MKNLLVRSKIIGVILSSALLFGVANLAYAKDNKDNEKGDNNEEMNRPTQCHWWKKSGNCGNNNQNQPNPRTHRPNRTKPQIRPKRQLDLRLPNQTTHPRTLHKLK